MTQEEFDKSPLLDQILYDCTGMLAENHPSIAEAMQKYADAQLLQTAVVGQSEQLCECEISKPIDPYDSIDKNICRDCKCIIA
jgi:hypothetical protein